MAIILCPECKKEISNKAQTCPHCGNPIQAVTIEQTSKEWKEIVILGWIVLLIGCGIIFYSIVSDVDSMAGKLAGPIVFILGLIFMIISDLGAWWNHK